MIGQGEIKDHAQLVQGAAEKGMLARGPELTMELFTPQSKEKESTERYEHQRQKACIS